MARHWQQVSLEEAQKNPLYGIKNWLAVFAFGVLLIPLREFGGLNGAAHDAGMTLTQFLEHNRAFGTYVKTVLTLETLMAAVIFWLLLSKQRSFRVVTSSLLLAHWPVISLVALATQAPEVGGVIGLGLISWVLSCAIWVTYLQRSRRVRVTFENCLVAKPLGVASASQADMFGQSEPGLAVAKAAPSMTKLSPPSSPATPTETNVLAKFGPWVFGAICLTALLLNISLKKEAVMDTQAAAADKVAALVLQSPVGTSVAGADSTHKTTNEIWQQEMNRVYQAEVDTLITTAKAEGLDYKDDAALSEEFNGLVRDFDAQAIVQGISDDGLKASKWALAQAHDVMKMRHADMLMNTTANMKDSTTTAVSSVILGRHPPVPTFSDASQRLAYLRWLDRMSVKLEKKLPVSQTRKEFLQTVWYESRRAGIDVKVTLSLIATLSNFSEAYTSENGAQGYMAVNSTWASKIGDGDVEKLLHLQTNMRFGSVVLRHYLDSRRGDLNEGLIDYVAENLGLNREDPRTAQLAARVIRDAAVWK